ncbi:MAG: tetratricopeptide repeat protein, partial [Lachnospiraceae bacterium]
MDKYEYKIRSEEIKTLIAKGEYVDAAAIADTIDWRRVKSVMMLCTISDLYKINRRFEDARDMLLLAYDRHPGGRSIVYSLCELSIKMGEFVQAVEYYKEFVQVAPKDSGRYVLQYKLYEAQDVSLEERIAVLEELKSKDYSEKWAYELAYLYHRIGLATKCVEECDELILWFGEGKYVLKAMELKMLHEPLTADQQERYNQMKGISQPAEQSVEGTSEPAEEQAEEDLVNAPTKEIPAQDLDIQVKLMGVGQYDTINIQKELAQNMKELWEGPTEASEEISAESVEEPSTGILSSDTGMIDLPDEESEEEPVEPEETKVEEVFFGETGEIDTTAAQVMEEMKKETLEPEEKEEEPIASKETENKVTPMSVEMPKEFNKILGMEYDGQISMIMPEAEQVEKQITGQIRLEDVLLEWEKMKKDSEQKRMEAVRQHVMEQTGAMFTEFDAAVRDGLLEKLEKGAGSNLPETEETETFADAEDIEEVQDIEEITENGDDGEIVEPEEIGEPEDIDETEEAEDVEEAEEAVEEAGETEELEEIEEAEEFEEIEELEEIGEPEDIEEAEELEEVEEVEDIEEADETGEVEDIEEAYEAAEADETGEAEDSEEADEAA